MLVIEMRIFSEKEFLDMVKSVDREIVLIARKGRRLLTGVDNLHSRCNPHPAQDLLMLFFKMVSCFPPFRFLVGNRELQLGNLMANLEM